MATLTYTTVNGNLYGLGETTAFQLALPTFHGKRSDYIVYNVIADNGDFRGYLVKGFHTNELTGQVDVYWSTSQGNGKRLTVGVKSRAAALRKLVK